MDTDRFLLLMAFVKIVALQHARHSIMSGELNKAAGRHLPHPPAVEFSHRLLWIENLEDLPLIGPGVFLYLLLCQDPSRFGDAGRIADHAGKIADQKDDVMPEILKMLQLVNQHRMAEMEIRRRRIEPRLDAQRPVLFE